MRLSTFAEKTDEPTTHIVLALLIAIGLQITLKDNLVFGSKYAVAGLETILLLVLIVPNLHAGLKRVLALVMMGFITLANVVSLGLVINALFNGGVASGRQLLVSSVAIYLTNIIVFGILYWELDSSHEDVPDFSFPQFSDPKQKDWRPTFFDYLYVSITNGTAFSPTDTLPLTHRAKLLMTIQAVTALLTVVLVAARAVNILS